MEKYEVKITDEALKDMEKIYEYIAYRLASPQNAAGQYNRIAESILSLDTFPERFPLFQIEPEYSYRLRRMPVDNYLVCYIVDPGIVTVTAVLYAASDVQSRLSEKHR